LFARLSCDDGWPDGGFQINYPKISHINELICLNGTVTKVNGRRVMETCQIFVCNKCGNEVVVKLDYTVEDLLTKPYRCSKEDCPSDKGMVLKNMESNEQ
jgi:DNA replicative helicase MCM subunit Mcm2 (Cdc46/Mcm family)